MHEVAHAWVRTGPTALVEGRAELLADCIVHARPGLAPLQWDDGRELTGMPDLKTWASLDDHGPSVNPLTRTDAYLGAARLVRLAGLLLPERALWPADDQIDWLDLDVLLTSAGQPGDLLRDVLRAEPAAQSRALSDSDQDGLPLVGEQMLGTDPARFDTDGDGWWDGAEVPADALPLPFDGTPMCSGWAVGPTGGTAVLRTGGNLRGSAAPMPVLRSGHDVVVRGGLKRPAGGASSVLVELDGGSEMVSGGLWAQVHGDGLIPDTACVGDERIVVWAADARWRDAVPAFAEALRQALLRADVRLGASPHRVAVVLGGTRTTVEGPVVRVSSDELTRRGIPSSALQAAAMRRVWDGSVTVRDWRDVEALTARLAAPE